MVLAAFMIALAVLAGLTVWCAVARWWHVAVILLGALLLFPLIARTLTGDLSRDLPEGTFAAGAEGKDQIILVSVAIMAAALLFWIVRAVLRRAARAGTGR
jgi:hypothetical protein